MASTDEDHPFVCFGLDAGETSGFGLTASIDIDSMEAHGVATTAKQRRAAVIEAHEFAEDLGLPLIVCAEAWPGRWPSQKSAMGMGRNFGKWLDHFELILGVTEKDLLRVNTMRWRNDLYGPEITRSARDLKGKYKGIACAYAGVLEHNEAEAMCITHWGRTSLEGAQYVQRLIFKARRW